MIRFYCRHKEGNEHLCGECAELLAYACKRLDDCPDGPKKPSCRKCEKHCYRPSMRKHIRDVMRFSGPRMMLYAPMSALRHMFNA